MDFLVKILFFCFIFCLHLAQSIRCQGKAVESVLLTKSSRRWNDKSLIWWFSIWYEWIFCSLFIFSLPPWSSEKYYATHNISACIYMLNHWMRFICLIVFKNFVSRDRHRYFFQLLLFFSQFVDGAIKMVLDWNTITPTIITNRRLQLVQHLIMRSHQYPIHQHLLLPVFLLNLQRLLHHHPTKEVQDAQRRFQAAALLLITIATFVWVMCMRIKQLDILKNCYLVQTVADQVLPILVSG